MFLKRRMLESVLLYKEDSRWKEDLQQETTGM